MAYEVWDRRPREVLVKVDPLGIAEWISIEQYNALVAAEEAANAPVPPIEPVPDTKVVKGRVAKKAKSPVRPIEDDGPPRA